jgi:hypothetical protein
LAAACKQVTDKRDCTPYLDAIRKATYDILERNKGPDNFPNSNPQAFGDISSNDKGTIQVRVRQLQE